LTKLVAAFLPLLLAPALQAWNYQGHLLSAYIAYKRLSPNVRAKVDDVLRRHPEYPRWMREAQQPDRGLEAFLQAAIWADVIKGDERFWDPGSRRSEPTPLESGYRDMQQHRDWHYRDQPISAPGAPAPPPRVPNLLTAIEAQVDRLDDPYDLAWFLHLAGDAHQPLHAVSRFLTPEDKGDRGGNDVRLDHPAQNLHSLWDQIVGREVNRAAIVEEG
jgi:hypothetical protein